MGEVRKLEQVSEDLLLPGVGLASFDLDSQRHLAIYRVLSELPDTDYRSLAAKVDTFEWFLPPVQLYGEVYPFFTANSEQLRPGDITLKPYATVIYLAPSLEQAAWDIAVGVVAHELAHIVLDHPLLVGGEEYGENEGQAWALVRSWGFGKEATKCLRRHKWQESYDRYLARKSLLTTSENKLQE